MKSAISFRPYQRAIFDDHTTGIQILLWARQTGKSFTLATWAVHRLLTRPGRLVTILSNSKSNGIELNRRCAEVCQLLHSAFEQVDLSPDNRFETFNTETRITINRQTGRIKVLAANPRTARGFSGDLILDEFAFHENAAAIWEAAEPILAANKDYLCRIASTPNGKHNMFYRLCNLGSPNLGSPSSSLASSSITLQGSRHDDPPTPSGSNQREEILTNSPPNALETNPSTSTPTNLIPISRVTRTDAWLQGCPVFHPITREPITPEQARALAQNKRAYDQNYQCVFEDENMALLTFELISAAERDDVGVVCEGNWNPEALAILEAGRVAPRAPRAYDDCSNNPSASSAQSAIDSDRSRPAREWMEAGEEARRLLLMSFCGGSADELDRVLRENTIIDLYGRGSNQSTGQRRLFAGVDVGRNRDWTVITVVEKVGASYLVRAILRLDAMRLPEQQKRIETILRLPALKRVMIDMTGLGLGLYEYTHERFGERVQGLNFASSVPLNPRLRAEGRTGETVRATEALATQLLQVFEDRALQCPVDSLLRDDLRKPERMTSPSGRVSIAASRDDSGHADHFWSLALAIEAAQGTVKAPPASAAVQLWRGNYQAPMGRAPRKHDLRRRNTRWAD